MLIKTWSSIEEVPFCFWRSSVKFIGHMCLKIVQCDPDWAFANCKSSLNSPMATKWCTKLEVVQKRCPIIFICDPSNSMTGSVCPSVRLSGCPSHLFGYLPIIVSSWHFQKLLPMTEVTSMQKVKVIRQISRSHGTKHCRFLPELSVSGL